MLLKNRMHFLLTFCSVSDARVLLLTMYENKSQQSSGIPKAKSSSPLGSPSPSGMAEASKRGRGGQQGGLHVPQGRGHHTTLQWPAIVSQPSKKLMPTCAGAWAPKSGIILCSQKQPCDTGGIRIKKPQQTRNQGGCLWLGHRRRKPERWLEKKGNCPKGIGPPLADKKESLFPTGEKLCIWDGVEGNPRKAPKMLWREESKWKGIKTTTKTYFHK